jgi:hypothetical protein
MEKYEELKNLVASIEDDATKFYEKGNKAAGVRFRKALQDVKTLAQNIRLDVSTKTKTVKA